MNDQFVVAPNHDQASDEGDLLQLFKSLWRGKWTSVLSTFVAAFSAHFMSRLS